MILLCVYVLHNVLKFTSCYPNSAANSIRPTDTVYWTQSSLLLPGKHSATMQLFTESNLFVNRIILELVTKRGNRRKPALEISINQPGKQTRTHACIHSYTHKFTQPLAVTVHPGRRHLSPSPQTSLPSHIPHPCPLPLRCPGSPPWQFLADAHGSQSELM